MPLYSYRCKDCGAEFETMRPVAGRDDPVQCTVCGKEQSERVYKPFSVSMAGEGAAPACPQARSCPHGGSCGCH